MNLSNSKPLIWSISVNPSHWDYPLFTDSQSGELLWPQSISTSSTLQSCFPCFTSPSLWCLCAFELHQSCRAAYVASSVLNLIGFGFCLMVSALCLIEPLCERSYWLISVLNLYVIALWLQSESKFDSLLKMYTVPHLASLAFCSQLHTHTHHLHTSLLASSGYMYVRYTIHIVWGNSIDSSLRSLSLAFVCAYKRRWVWGYEFHWIGSDWHLADQKEEAHGSPSVLFSITWPILLASLRLLTPSVSTTGRWRLAIYNTDIFW